MHGAAGPWSSAYFPKFIPIQTDPREAFPVKDPNVDSSLPGPSVYRIPDGDDRERLTCPNCGWIDYRNPKIVAGAVVVAEDGRVLLCKRAIEPRSGHWTLPAGYMELGETPEEGAAREVWEEARARITLDGLMAVYSVPRISQVQLLFRARLVGNAFEAGPESLEVRLFGWDEIESMELAFPTVRWALNRARRIEGEVIGAPEFNPGDPDLASP